MTKLELGALIAVWLADSPRVFWSACIEFRKRFGVTPEEGAALTGRPARALASKIRQDQEVRP